jgi:hypothetical protein
LRDPLTHHRERLESSPSQLRFGDSTMATEVRPPSPTRHSQDAVPASTAEKVPVEEEKIDLGAEAEDDHDIFKPFPLLEGVPHEENPLTFRAVLIGVVLGSLVNASNVYLGKYLPMRTRSHASAVARD